MTRGRDSWREEQNRKAERQLDADRDWYVQEIESAMRGGVNIPDSVLAWMIINVSPLPTIARAYIARRLEGWRPKGRPSERLRQRLRVDDRVLFPAGSLAAHIAELKADDDLLREFDTARASLGSAKKAYKAVATRRFKSEATIRDAVRAARRRLAE